MSLVDKIKNALFEVEYVEVPKEEPKAKIKKEEKEEKPIAQKVVLPHKRKTEIPIEIRDNYNNSRQVQESEINNEPQVISTENARSDFKFMDDNDFIDDYYRAEEENNVDAIQYENEVKPKVEDRVIYKENAPYGIDESNKNLVQPYGRAYEKKEEKVGFKPSPIISPIYGVLDKNYRKEDVREKNSTRSSYSREKVNLDEVRDKAYGKKEVINSEPLITKREEKKVVFETEDPEDDTNLLVDLSSADDKPSIKEVTMGDAIEYFNDLGLEYNVDYMDSSKERIRARKSKEIYEDEQPELFAINNDDFDDDIVPPKAEKTRSMKYDNNIKDSVTLENEIDVENEDNLFDLIDSMYIEK